MNKIIEQKIKELQEAVFEYGDDQLVSLNLFFNCEGLEIRANHRARENLEPAGISMRNIRGDFIK